MADEKKRHKKQIMKESTVFILLAKERVHQTQAAFFLYKLRIER